MTTTSPTEEHGNHPGARQHGPQRCSDRDPLALDVVPQGEGVDGADAHQGGEHGEGGDAEEGEVTHAME